MVDVESFCNCAFIYLTRRQFHQFCTAFMQRNTAEYMKKTKMTRTERVKKLWLFRKCCVAQALFTKKKKPVLSSNDFLLHWRNFHKFNKLFIIVAIFALREQKKSSLKKKGRKYRSKKTIQFTVSLKDSAATYIAHYLHSQNDFAIELNRMSSAYSRFMEIAHRKLHTENTESEIERKTCLILLFLWTLFQLRISYLSKRRQNKKGRSTRIIFKCYFVLLYVFFPRQCSKKTYRKRLKRRTCLTCFISTIRFSPVWFRLFFSLISIICFPLESIAIPNKIAELNDHKLGCEKSIINIKEEKKNL